MAVVTGTSAGEPLTGTAGNDTVTGAGGADTIAVLGGNDLSLWNFGDGSDVVGGGTGTDTARLASAGGSFNVSASGSGTVFVAAGVGGGAEIVALNDIERLELQATAFYNSVTVGDLSGTDVTKVTVDFAGANDFVAAHASSANNTLTVTAAGTTINIAGLPTLFAATHAVGTDAVEVHGADGNDKLSGATLGAGRILLVLQGDDGNDSLTGSVNDDGLHGGTGNDTVVGGRGNDTVLLGSGNDLFLWSAGDGGDTIDGGADFDTLRMTASNADEVFSLFALQLDQVERVEFRALGGADFININKLTGTGITSLAIDLAATVGGKTADTKVDIIDIGPDSTSDTIAVTTLGTKILVSGLDGEVSIDHAGKTDIMRITGGLGNDVIDASALAAGKITLELLGNSSNDTITGSAGNDWIFEAGGDDVVSAGAGNDIIDWTNGNGDDVIDGGKGFDRLIVGGQGIVSIAGFSGYGLLSRADGASIIMSGIERIELDAWVGADNFTIGDLTGSEVQQVAIDLGSFDGKGGNGEADSLHAAGTAGNDAIMATFAGGVIGVTGLPKSLTIVKAESTDHLVLDGADGNDLVDVSKIAAAIGTGVSGGAGFDTLRFTGLAGDEKFTIDELTLGQFGIVRDVGNVTINGTGVERIEINTLGGADTVTVGDPSSQGVTQVAIDLAPTVGGKTGDAKIDTILADGTIDDDNILLSRVGGKIVRAGLPIELSIDHADKTDRLVIHAGGGHDFIDASIIPAAKIALKLFGDEGDDFIWSSAGDDLVQGGIGNDLVVLGAGNDLFEWFSGDGDDQVEGQIGTDTVSAFLTSAPDAVDIAADGDRVSLGVPSESAVLDIDDVERFLIQAGGGADSISVHDLAGTDAKLISIDLGTSFSPTGDGQGDAVFIDGTNGNDTITASLVAGAVSIKGLPAQLSIAHVEAIDGISIIGGGGNDSISVAALPTKAGQLILVGGAGNDTLTGGGSKDLLSGDDGNDKLVGGGGNDELSGGDGNDNLDGGAGDDTLSGGTGNDVLAGGIGNDVFNGARGDDTMTGGAGSDQFRYTSVLDGHDVLIGFDGNAAGGQDTLGLDLLFDSLGVGTADRAGRVSVFDKGASVDVVVDTDGNLFNGFELTVATLKTADVITIGQDILVGTL